MNWLRIWIAIGCCFSNGASAQVIAYSDVGGYDTIQVLGANDSRPNLTFAATQFLLTQKYSGVAVVITPDILHDASATWNDEAFSGLSGPHYIEILKVNGSSTAPGVGLTRTIATTISDSKHLKLEIPLPDGLAGLIVEYRVIPHWTLGSLFGAANSAGLQGGTPVNADMVQIWNGETFDQYYYQTSGLGGVGWRKVEDRNTDASGTIIRQDQSLVIKRVSASSLPIVVNGWVKKGQASLEIYEGFNFVPNPFTGPLTLDGSGLHTGDPTTGLAAGDPTTADQLMLWNGKGYTTFYYQSSGLGGQGWRRLGAQSTDAGGTVIRPGAGIIISRKRDPGFIWAIPQP